MTAITKSNDNCALLARPSNAIRLLLRATELTTRLGIVTTGCCGARNSKFVSLQLLATLVDNIGNGRPRCAATGDANRMTPTDSARLDRETGGWGSYADDHGVHCTYRRTKRVYAADLHRVRSGRSTSPAPLHCTAALRYLPPSTMTIQSVTLSPLIVTAPAVCNCITVVAGQRTSRR